MELTTPQLIREYRNQFEWNLDITLIDEAIVRPWLMDAILSRTPAMQPSPGKYIIR